MNILITGGAGFIGSHLAEALLRNGHDVTVLDNLSPQIHGAAGSFDHLPSGVRTLHGDVREASDWRRAIDGQNIIVHLAAETGTGQSMYEVDRYTDVNIGGTSRLCEILTNEEHTIERIIVASSRAIYGEGRHKCSQHGVVFPGVRDRNDMAQGDFAVKCPICGRDTEILATSEDSKIHPTSIYGITKQVQEQLFLTVGRSLGMPAVALRYQNVYGPGQSLRNPYTGILSIFSTRLLNGNEILIFEDGLESRDFVFIEDVVKATVLACEQPLSRGDALAVNVGSGVRTDVRTVVRSLSAAFSIKADVVTEGNFRVGDIRDNYADLALAKSVLKFEPEIEFEEGIRRFVEWVRSQEIPADEFDRSIAEMKAKRLYN